MTSEEEEKRQEKFRENQQTLEDVGGTQGLDTVAAGRDCDSQ